MRTTPPHMHPTPPLMHPTPPHMHTTPPMSGSFTRLLSTPSGYTSFPSISPTTFISPTGYTLYFSTIPSTYFPMPSMQSSGSIHMELGRSSMPRPMPSKDDHGDTITPGDSSALGETNAQEDTSSTEGKTRTEHILKRNEPQKEEFDRQLAIQLSEHPELEPPPGYPFDLVVGFQT
ncbi:unnamed protein product [Vicia faba]|uniref:Uncharacterized protein n=1 Tax=Vicia faba TaxID=3906 RepID=A0AAV0ZIB5_VICFA|nr:unnamed protein product [Vicia faba]